LYLSANRSTVLTRCTWSADDDNPSTHGASRSRLLHGPGDSGARVDGRRSNLRSYLRCCNSGSGSRDLRRLLRRAPGL
jgi:hypothetical protein